MQEGESLQDRLHLPRVGIPGLPGFPVGFGIANALDEICDGSGLPNGEVPHPDVYF